MSTFAELQQIANDDVKVIIGSEKQSPDVTIETNAELDVARDHLDEIEDRNAATIDILTDTVVATESRDLTDRELKVLRTTLKALTGEKPIRHVALEDGEEKPLNRTLALEGFKDTLKKFWAYIKEQAKKFWNLLKRWWFKTFDISKRARVRAEKIMKDADNEYGVSADNDINFKEIKKLAINGRINDSAATLKGLKDLESIVFEFINSTTSERFNDTAQALTDKATVILNGIKSHADALIKARGEDGRVERADLSIRSSDLDDFNTIVEQVYAGADSDLVNHRDFGLDKADRYLKQYGEPDKTTYRHSEYLPGDKWILCVKPTLKSSEHTVDITTTIDGLRASRLIVAPCLYADKQYDPDPLVKVLATTSISRGCESIIRICEYINEYRTSFDRRDRFKERVIKDIDQAVNDVSQENESAYAECDRVIRSFANAIVGLIRRRSDFETSLCAYSMTTSVAFLNYSELSLKQYTK